jgi:hypothetical protein
MLRPIPQPTPINISDHAKRAQADARHRAQSFGRSAPTRVDWLMALLEGDPTVATLLITRLCPNVAAVHETIAGLERRNDLAVCETVPNFLWENAKKAAVDLGHGYIGPEHIILALSREETAVGDALRSAHVTWDDMRIVFESIEWNP